MTVRVSPGYKPQLVVSNVGIDPTTVGGLLKTISKGKASGTALIEGAITDGYLPSVNDTANPWVQLFMKIHDQYDKSAPFDGNVEYGMANAYTLVQALQAAGKNLTRQDVVNAINTAGAGWKGPGLVPFRYSKTEHGGYSGVEMVRYVAARSSCSAVLRPLIRQRAPRSRRTQGRSPRRRRTEFPAAEGSATGWPPPMRLGWPPSPNPASERSPAA